MYSELNLSYDIHSIVSGAPGLAANKQSKKTQKKPCDQESFSICEVSLAKSKSYTSYHTKFDVFNFIFKCTIKTFCVVNLQKKKIVEAWAKVTLR